MNSNKNYITLEPLYPFRLKTELQLAVVKVFLFIPLSPLLSLSATGSSQVLSQISVLDQLTLDKPRQTKPCDIKHIL